MLQMDARKLSIAHNISRLAADRSVKQAQREQQQAPLAPMVMHPHSIKMLWLHMHHRLAQLKK